MKNTRKFLEKLLQHMTTRQIKDAFGEWDGEVEETPDLASVRAFVLKLYDAGADWHEG